MCSSDLADYHGWVLRYDMQGTFKSLSSYAAFDASNIGGLAIRGYVGAVYDGGKYVYFVPYYYGGQHARVLRYDTSREFTSGSSWVAYDAGTTGGLITKGYIGGVYLNGYIYLAPYHDGSDYSGKVLRIKAMNTLSSLPANFAAE